MGILCKGRDVMPKRRHVKIRPDKTGLNFLTGGPAGVGDFDDEKILRKERAREQRIIEGETQPVYKESKYVKIIKPIVNKWPNSVDLKAMIVKVGIVGTIITGVMVSSLAGILVLLGTGLSFAGVHYAQKLRQNEQRQPAVKTTSGQGAKIAEKAQEHHASQAVRPDKRPKLTR